MSAVLLHAVHVLTSAGGRQDLAAGTAPAVPFQDLEARLPQPNSLRRASDASKRAVLAAAFALQGRVVTERLGLYTAQQQGPLDYTARFLQASYRDGPRLAGPMFFSESVANNTATHLSLTLGFTGVVQTFIGCRTAGIQAVMAARDDVLTGVVDDALVVVQGHADRLTSDAYNAVYAPFSRYRPPPAIRFLAGAVAFLISRAGDGPRLAFADVRCQGLEAKDQETATRELWRAFGRRDLPVATSTFCLARDRSLSILARALGTGITAAPPVAGALGEAFALDPILQAVVPQAPRAVVCLGEDGTAGLLALEP